VRIAQISLGFASGNMAEYAPQRCEVTRCYFEFFVVLHHLFRITSHFFRITSSFWYYFHTFFRITSPFRYYFHTFCRITSPFWYYFHTFCRITSPFWHYFHTCSRITSPFKLQWVTKLTLFISLSLRYCWQLQYMYVLCRGYIGHLH
jgi:hypothetical protein